MQVAAFVFDSLVGVILYLSEEASESLGDGRFEFLFAFGPRGHTLGGTP